MVRYAGPLQRAPSCSAPRVAPARELARARHLSARLYKTWAQLEPFIKKLDTARLVTGFPELAVLCAEGGTASFNAARAARAPGSAPPPACRHCPWAQGGAHERVLPRVAGT